MAQRVQRTYSPTGDLVSEELIWIPDEQERREQIETQSRSAIATLEGYARQTSWTNAQVVAALRRIAAIEARILRLLLSQLDSAGEDGT